MKHILTLAAMVICSWLLVAALNAAPEQATAPTPTTAPAPQWRDTLTINVPDDVSGMVIILENGQRFYLRFSQEEGKNVGIRRVSEVKQAPTTNRSP